MSNQYGNTGIQFTSLSTPTADAHKLPFVSDPLNQTTAWRLHRHPDPQRDRPDTNIEVVRGSIGLDHTTGRRPTISGILFNQTVRTSTTRT
jgi:hypothetical protein